MRLAQVSAARGAHWVFQGWRIFVKRPLGFAVLMLTMMVAMLLTLLVPWVGLIAALAVLPLATLGFMIGTRDALAGRFPTPAVFVVPLRKGDAARRVALVQLCAIYAAAAVGILVVSGLVDGGRLGELQSVMGSAHPEDKRRAAELIADANLRWGLAIRFGLLSLLSIPFWHAPALVHWAEQGAAQSLFSSTVAVWRNRWAFVVYALGWVAAILGFGVVAGLLGSFAVLRPLIGLMAAPFGLLCTAAFYASLYFTYADCFEDAG